MFQEIMCNRVDCDFYLDGKCSYGGTAVCITDDGCQTYEPCNEGDD